MATSATNRLIVRAFDPSDSAALEAVFCDPQVMLYGTGVKSRDWVNQWIEQRIDSYHNPLGPGMWAVELPHEPAVIGYCGLTSYPDVGGRPEVEVGYRLARRYWGHGYATEAATAVRDHAFSALQLPRLIALIDPRNTSSIRVATKLGMRYERDAVVDGFLDRVYAIEANSRS